MKKLTLGLSAAVLALAGAAYAQPGMHAKHDTDGDGVVSRAEAQAHADQIFSRMDANSDGKLDQADRDRRLAFFLGSRLHRTLGVAPGQRAGRWSRLLSLVYEPPVPGTCAP